MKYYKVILDIKVENSEYTEHHISYFSDINIAIYFYYTGFTHNSKIINRSLSEYDDEDINYYLIIKDNQNEI